MNDVLGQQQGPSDAQQVLAGWSIHAVADPGLNNGADAQAALSFWHQAHASGELQAAYAAIAQVGEFQPQAGAIWVDWGCWRPARHQQALLDADAWLQSAQLPGQQASAELTEYVQLRRDWLADQIAAQQSIDQAAERSGTWSFAALLGAGIVAWLGWRLARVCARPAE